MGFWQFSWNFVNDEVMGFLGSSMSMAVLKKV